MKINGVELQDIDILDLEVAEKYETALESIENIAETVEGMKYPKVSELNVMPYLKCLTHCLVKVQIRKYSEIKLIY